MDLACANTGARETQCKQGEGNCLHIAWVIGEVAVRLPTAAHSRGW